MPKSVTRQRIVIILNEPSNQDDWLEVIKMTVIEGEIQELVNFRIAKNSLSIFKEPLYPILQYVNYNKITIAQLTDAEKE